MGIFTGLFKSRDKPQNSYDSPSYTYFFGRANSGKRVTDRTALHFRGNNIALSGMNTSDASAENLPFELKKVIGM